MFDHCGWEFEQLWTLDDPRSLRVFAEHSYCVYNATWYNVLNLEHQYSCRFWLDDWKLRVTPGYHKMILSIISSESILGQNIS